MLIEDRGHIHVGDLAGAKKCRGGKQHTSRECEFPTHSENDYSTAWCGREAILGAVPLSGRLAVER